MEVGRGSQRVANLEHGGESLQNRRSQQQLEKIARGSECNLPSGLPLSLGYATSVDPGLY